MEPMAFIIGVDQSGGAGAMPDLWQRLAQGAPAGCHFELRSGRPVPQTLGGLPEILASVGAGAATGCAAVIIAWLRERTSNVEITVTREDGAVSTVKAERCGRVDAAALAEFLRERGELSEPAGE
ncbi:hypothetical protein [Streptomyces sp. NPDC057623]|uniref:effector-associated constant component EACC1 n=1 Tax=Streptomyces sp. NPDC057623 TaxID=3346187 RepID=UPI00367A5F89